ncbi:MAG TPA: hypothetical protein VHG32_16380 [Thermoanaerobaculia bacterium]|nr:hypothetical protein [Thermoanaerobaculia bacterium]
MLREAKEGDSQLRDQMTLILNAATLGLTAALFLLAVLSVVGWREISQLRGERTKALQEREAVQELRRGIDQHILAHVKSSIEKAWSGMDSQFDKLPQLGDQRRLAGSDPEPVSAEMKQAYEETDVLVVLGDKLDALGTATRATDYFNRLARFWWGTGDWARGAARSKRAIEIDPVSFRAQVAYAVGLMDRSSRLPAQEMRTKLLLLAEAERLLLKAKLLKPEEGPHLFHKLGWIYDEQGDFTRAAEAYSKALSGTLAPELTGRYGYDLACTLCKNNQLQEALETLTPIIDLDDNRRLAAIDPDFELLRQSATLKERFAALVAGT